jgi:hypothetical protein
MLIVRDKDFCYVCGTWTFVLWTSSCGCDICCIYLKCDICYICLKCDICYICLKCQVPDISMCVEHGLLCYGLLLVVVMYVVYV